MTERASNGHPKDPSKDPPIGPPEGPPNGSPTNNCHGKGSGKSKEKRNGKGKDNDKDSGKGDGKGKGDAKDNGKAKGNDNNKGNGKRVSKRKKSMGQDQDALPKRYRRLDTGGMDAGGHNPSVHDAGSSLGAHDPFDDEGGNPFELYSTETLDALEFGPPHEGMDMSNALPELPEEDEAWGRDWDDDEWWNREEARENDIDHNDVYYDEDFNIHLRTEPEFRPQGELCYESFAYDYTESHGEGDSDDEGGYVERDEDEEAEEEMKRIYDEISNEIPELFPPRNLNGDDDDGDDGDDGDDDEDDDSDEDGDTDGDGESDAGDEDDKDGGKDEHDKHEGKDGNDSDDNVGSESKDETDGRGEDGNDDTDDSHGPRPAGSNESATSGRASSRSGATGATRNTAAGGTMARGHPRHVLRRDTLEPDASDEDELPVARSGMLVDSDPASPDIPALAPNLGSNLALPAALSDDVGLGLTLVVEVPDDTADDVVPSLGNTPGATPPTLDEGYPATPYPSTPAPDAYVASASPLPYFPAFASVSHEAYAAAYAAALPPGTVLYFSPHDRAFLSFQAALAAEAEAKAARESRAAGSEGELGQGGEELEQPDTRRFYTPYIEDWVELVVPEKPVVSAAPAVVPAADVQGTAANTAAETAPTATTDPSEGVAVLVAEYEAGAEEADDAENDDDDEEMANDEEEDGEEETADEEADDTHQEEAAQDEASHQGQTNNTAVAGNDEVANDAAVANNDAVANDAAVANNDAVANAPSPASSAASTEVEAKIVPKGGFRFRPDGVQAGLDWTPDASTKPMPIMVNAEMNHFTAQGQLWAVGDIIDPKVIISGIEFRLPPAVFKKATPPMMPDRRRFPVALSDFGSDAGMAKDKSSRRSSDISTSSSHTVDTNVSASSVESCGKMDIDSAYRALDNEYNAYVGLWDLMGIYIPTVYVWAGYRGCLEGEHVVVAKAGKPIAHSWDSAARYWKPQLTKLFNILTKRGFNRDSANIHHFRRMLDRPDRLCLIHFHGMTRTEGVVPSQRKYDKILALLDACNACRSLRLICDDDHRRRRAVVFVSRVGPPRRVALVPAWARTKLPKKLV